MSSDYTLPGINKKDVPWPPQSPPVLYQSIAGILAQTTQTAISQPLQKFSQPRYVEPTDCGTNHNNHESYNHHKRKQHHTLKQTGTIVDKLA